MHLKFFEKYTFFNQLRHLNVVSNFWGSLTRERGTGREESPLNLMNDEEDFHETYDDRES